MPNMIDIRLLGAKDLQRKLNRLELKTGKKIVRRALRKGGRPVLATAIAGCPVKTGRLKKSLVLKARKPHRGYFGVEVRTGTREELGIAPDDKSFYPASVEYGHGNVPAHPYLRPAMDANRERAKGIITRHIRAGIVAEARGA